VKLDLAVLEEAATVMAQDFAMVDLLEND